MPFQISPDPRFLWLGKKHKEALAVLKYWVLNNQGFLLLTGDVGIGKTTLINALVNSLGPETLFINVTDPRLDKLDFFRFVAHSFGLETKLTTKFDFLMAFKDFLDRAHDSKKNVLLIIDEAQKLSFDSLEGIRLLSNLERQDTKLLNVFFIGQKEFNDTLLRPECRALRQRITIAHHIEALDENETQEYVKYRLSVAGAQRQVFTDKAIRKIYAFSRGYPRLINIVCDRALLDGYTMDLQTIDHKIIHESARELSLPGEMGQQTLKEVVQWTRPPLRRVTTAAIFAGLILSLAASRGDHGFDLGKHYGTLLGIGSSTSLENSEQSDSFREPRLVIPFGHDKNDLPPGILAKLDELVRYLIRKTDSDIVIRGYTDALGSKEYNRNLSSLRANVVKSYLAGKGISPNRMKAIGMGDAAPRMDNTTSEGRAANRRVEIELVAHKP